MQWVLVILVGGGALVGTVGLMARFLGVNTVDEAREMNQLAQTLDAPLRPERQAERPRRRPQRVRNFADRPEAIAVQARRYSTPELFDLTPAQARAAARRGECTTYGYGRDRSVA